MGGDVAVSITYTAVLEAESGIETNPIAHSSTAGLSTFSAVYSFGVAIPTTSCSDTVVP